MKFNVGDMVEVGGITWNGKPIRGKVAEISTMRDYDSKMKVSTVFVYRISYPESSTVNGMWWTSESLRIVG